MARTRRLLFGHFESVVSLGKHIHSLGAQAAACNYIAYNVGVFIAAGSWKFLLCTQIKIGVIFLFGAVALQVRPHGMLDALLTKGWWVSVGVGSWQMWLMVIYVLNELFLH